jgi:hypothetical protein
MWKEFFHPESHPLLSISIMNAGLIPCGVRMCISETNPIPNSFKP